RGLHGPDAADGGNAGAGDRADAPLPRDRRRLPAPALPRRSRRVAAAECARAAPDPGRGGRARAPPRVRDRSPGARAGRAGAPAGRREARADGSRPGRRGGARVTAELAGSPARSIVVISAGLGVPSSTRLLGDRLAAATERHLRDAGLEPTVRVVELREHAQDLVNHLLTGFPSRALQAAIDAAQEADGLIAVSPIFNASYSGLFKLFFDVIEKDGLAGKPALIAATGGTSRHSLAIDHALRP